SEMIGRTIDAVVPAEHRSREREVFARVLRGESVLHFETVGLKHDGSTFPIWLTMSRVLAPDGQLIALSRIIRDVSVRKTLEREAHRLAAIVDSSEDAIVSKDLNGIVQTWNKAAERMFGYTAEEIIGTSIRTIIPAERMGEEDNVLARIRAGVAIDHFETIRQHKDGHPVEISLSVSPIRTADGKVVGASK